MNKSSKPRMTMEQINAFINEGSLYPERTKVKLTDIENEELTITDYTLVSTETSHYYGVCFKEYEDAFVLSNTALTKLLDQPYDMYALKIKIEPLKKTKNGNDYRAVTILGYDETLIQD